MTPTRPTPRTTSAALDMVRAALDEARALHSPVIGQEHVLLAIAARPESLAAAALAAVTGVATSPYRVALLQTISPRAVPPPAPPEPTPRLIRALEEADQEAAEHGRPATSADLVAGILRSGIGVGFRLLTWQDVSLDAVRGVLGEAGFLDGHAELGDTSEVPLAAVFSGAAEA